jgi:hypothetical protein
VEDGPPPAFAQALNRGQFVHDTRGEDQTPRSVFVGAGAHGEATRHGPRVRDGGVSPRDGRVGEELGPTIGRNCTRVLSVLTQEAVRSGRRAVAPLSGVQNQNVATCASEL